MSEIPDILVRAIGRVETTVTNESISAARRTIESDIVVFDQYVDGLLGITEYSHLIALFWMDRTPPQREMRVHPRGDRSLPLTGVLASRGRNHPNPIGLAVVELLKVTGPRLTVRRLDAYDGTAIIDIKPYDDYDRVHEPRTPAWFSARAKRSGTTR